MVAALGDSITAGTPLWDPDPALRAQIPAPDPRSQYGWWAERALADTDFRNCGVPGERTDEIAARLDECARGADVLVVQGGVNDIAQGLAPPVAAANLRAMVRRGKRLGLAVTIVELLPWNGGYPSADPAIRALNRRIADIARGRGGHAQRVVRRAGGPAPARAHAPALDDRPRAPVGRPATGAWARRSSCPEPARGRAAKTASIISSVSLPVNVFCWLGWKLPSSIGPPGRRVLGGVPEARLGTQPEQPAGRVPGEGAQADDHRRPQQLQLLGGVGQAVVALGRQRLVGRRSAAHRRADERAAQAQPVVAVDRRGLVGEARPVHATRTASRRSGRR